MSFDNWRERLKIAATHKTVAARREATAALKINFSQPGPEDEGYYRKPITIKDPSGNGRNIITGWVPVAYFLDTMLNNNVLYGLIGAGDDMRDLTPAEIADEQLWSWVVSYPISHELYQAVAERGEPWPDGSKATPEAPEGHRVQENTAPAPVTAADHLAIIEKLTLSVPKAIGSREEAEAALGIKNVIAEKRLAADKAGRAIYEPLYRDYQKEQKDWVKPVKVAGDAEAGITRLYNRWLEAERQRVAAENARIAREREEEEERNQRAADRAIASGEPEPEPEVTEEVYQPVTPEPVKPTYGGMRAAKAELKTFVDIIDEGKVAAYFRGTPELVAVLQMLAERATKLGQEVPGTTSRQGYA